MGRYRASKKRRKRRKKAHESDPEIAGTETRGDSPAWNSLDELSLIDYGRNGAGSESDEVEVTKRLSCLNFSAIPCAIDPENFSCGHEVGNIPGGMADEQSEVELVTSATYLDILPTDSENLNRRQSRKRASRRRPNKKVKKMKSSNYMSGYHGTTHCSGYGKAKRSYPSQSLRYNPLSRKSPKSRSTSAGSTPVRVHSPAKRMMEVEEEDTGSMYLFSDTSAVCEIEMIQDADDMFDCTPPTSDPVSNGYSYHNDLSGNESELSESTTDRWVWPVNHYKRRVRLWPT